MRPVADMLTYKQLLLLSTQRSQELMATEITPNHERWVKLYTPVWLGCPPPLGTSVLSTEAAPRRIKFRITANLLPELEFPQMRQQATWLEWLPIELRQS